MALFRPSLLTFLLGLSFFIHQASTRIIPQPPLVLSCHGGQVLSPDYGIAVNVMWYGSFSDAEKAPVLDFLSSFHFTTQGGLPTVADWWKVMTQYSDAKGMRISSNVQLGQQISDAGYSLGKLLNFSDIEILVQRSFSQFTVDSSAIYLVLTAHDVAIVGFCVNQCSTHSFIDVMQASGKPQRLVYAWAGNSVSQCPGQCSWPFAVPELMKGSNMVPLLPPNGDVGVDGMVMNIAAMIAGAASNPFGNAFFKGLPQVPLEAATSCLGIFGEHAYPGSPGKLLTHQTTGTSFNAVGINNRMFLLPTLWNPATLACHSPLSKTM